MFAVRFRATQGFNYQRTTCNTPFQRQTANNVPTTHAPLAADWAQSENAAKDFLHAALKPGQTNVTLATAAD